MITCHVETTKECLKYCYKSFKNIDKYQHDIYLLDDNSNDKTGEIVKKSYPDINVIHGDGFFFWSKGTRKAWEYAYEKKDYDFYIWLNDDVKLFKNAFLTMYNDFSNSNLSIIVGTLKSSDINNEIITYGGRDKNFDLIIPSGKTQNCVMMNGNFVFIHKNIFDSVGFIDKTYTHNYGDIDYGLCAIKKGFQVKVSSKIIGICDVNKIEKWRDENFNFFKRVKSLVNSKNFRIKEVIYFQLKHFGVLKMLKHIMGIIFILLSPRLYKKLKK